MAHPIDTGEAIWDGISTSWEDDVINGDAESRGHFIGKAVGNVAIALAGGEAVEGASAAIQGTEVTEDLTNAARIVEETEDTTAASSQDENLIPCHCFTAGTAVLTLQGEKPIEQVKVGDKVFSKNPDTGEMEYKEVDMLFQREVDETYNNTFGQERITTTDEHLFWIEISATSRYISTRFRM